MAGRDLLAIQPATRGRDLFATPQQPTVQRGPDFISQVGPQQQVSQVPDFFSELAQEESEGIRGLLRTGAISTGRGLFKIGRALGLADPETETERRAFEALGEERPIVTTAGEIVGESLPFAAIPGTGVAKGVGSLLTRAGARRIGQVVAGRAGQIAATGAIGATEGGVIAKGQGERLEEQLGAAGIGGSIAAGIEAFSPLLGRLSGSLIRRLTGKAPKGALLTPQGLPTPELQTALDATGTTFDDLTEGAADLLSEQIGADPAQAARKAFLESQGLVAEGAPTTAQVTRGATEFQAQQEAAKTSGRVRARLESQQGILTNKFDEAVAGTSGQPVSSGSPVFDHIRNKSTVLDNEISELYDLARKRAKESIVSKDPTEFLFFKTGRFDRQGKDLFTEVVKNPSQNDFMALRKEFRKDFPNAPQGEVITRKTIDKEGNKYIWRADQGTHGDIEPFINKRFNTKTNQSFDEKIITDAEKVGNIVNLEGTIDKLESMRPSDKIMGSPISALEGEARRLGIVEVDDEGIRTIVPTTVENAELLRKFSNQLFNSVTDFGRIGLRRFRNAIDDDVTKSAGEDVFKQGRAAKASFEKDLSRAKIDKFDRRDKSIVRDILDNKLDPDTLSQDIITKKSVRSEDLKNLKTYLTTGPQAAEGKKAFNDLRAEALDYIKNNSFVGPEDALGNKNLSKTALNRSMKKIGMDKMKVLFNQEERKFLSDMQKVAGLLEPVRGTFIGKGPSAQGVDAAMKSIQRRIDKIPLLNVFVDLEFDGASGVLKGKPVIRQRDLPALQQLISGAAPAVGVAGVLQPDSEER